MPKTTKTPEEPRHSTPMPARVWEDEEFRPICVVTEKGPHHDHIQPTAR